MGAVARLVFFPALLSPDDLDEVCSINPRVESEQAATFLYIWIYSVEIFQEIKAQVSYDLPQK